MNPWNERFKAEQFVYGTEPNIFLQEQLAVFNGKQKIACYAEGEGRNAVFLARYGKTVTAYDYAQEGLTKTNRLAEQQGVSVETELTDLLVDALKQEVYDGAVMIFGHFAKEQQYDVLNKIMQSLKPGGVLLLELYEDGQLAYNTGGPRELNYLYNEQALKSWAKTYEILHFACVEVERTEGILHTGVCKVLQCVVKK